MKTPKVLLALAAVVVLCAGCGAGDPSEQEVSSREKSAKEISDRMDREKGIEPTQEEGQN
jgi:outer membrane lipoprotein-sorting protein